MIELVVHRATFRATRAEWEAVRRWCWTRVGYRRLAGTISSGLTRYRLGNRRYEHGVGYLNPPDDDPICLRFSGGSIRKVAEAVSALTGGINGLG